MNKRIAAPHRWILLVVLLVSPAAAQSVRLDSYVNDYAGIIDSATRQQLETALQELEQKTTAQFVILTIPSTNGRDLYEYGREVFNNAGATGKGLGQKGKDNGVLLVIAHKDRQYRFFIGQGIEDTLPDLYTDQIAQEFLIPQFRKSNFSAGVRDSALAVANKLAEESGVTLNNSPMPQRVSSRRNAPPRGFGPPMVFMVIVIMLVLQAMARKRRYSRARWGSNGFWSALFWNAVINAGTRSRGGGSSWGGGGGFGGGGFGGGGGGSFGGGGSGGSW